MSNVPLPNKKYNIIYADPAWKYWIGGKKNQSNHYSCMTIEEIQELPVKNIVDKNCLLFMWVTFPILDKSFDVIKSWGFEYSTCAFVWVKTNKNFKTEQVSFLPMDSFDSFWGLGYWTRSNVELCLLAKKGSLEKKSSSVHQLIYEPVREHSRKPDCVKDKIISLVGGAYGAFEVYKDYMDMKEQIQSYVAPDLSGFENRLNVFEEKTNGLALLLNDKINNMETLLNTEVSGVKVLLTTELDKATQLVQSAQEDARSIRTDMRKDLTEIQDSIAAVDKRSRNMNTEVREALRQAETDLRSLIDHANDRFDSKRTAIESDGQRRIEIIDTKLEALEKKITEMLQRALNNPLTGQ